MGGEIANPVIKSIKIMKKKVRLVGADVSPHSVGLYLVDSAYLIPRASQVEEYKKRLKQIIVSENVDLLIPGSDNELPIISEMSDNRELPCKIVVASNKAIMVSRHKLDTYKFFEKYKLPFAATADKKNIVKLVEKNGFPIIAKPASGSGSLGIKIFFNMDELKETHALPNYVFQELISPNGKSEIKKSDIYYNGSPVQKNEISTQLYLNRKGKVLGVLSSNNNLKNGMPVYVCPSKMPEIEPLIKKMAEKLALIGLRGPVNFQSKLTNDGFKVFEINMRYTGITGARSEIGYNDVEAAVMEYLYDADDETIMKSLNADYTKCILRHYGDEVVNQESVSKMEALIK